MVNKKFLLQVIEDIKQEENNSNWRGTITCWIKC